MKMLARAKVLTRPFLNGKQLTAIFVETPDEQKEMYVTRKYTFTNGYSCDVVPSNNWSGQLPADSYYRLVDEYGTPFCTFTKDQYEFITSLIIGNNTHVDRHLFFKEVNWLNRPLVLSDKKDFLDKKIITYKDSDCVVLPSSFETYNTAVEYMSLDLSNVFRLLTCTTDSPILTLLRNTYSYKSFEKGIDNVDDLLSFGKTLDSETLLKYSESLKTSFAESVSQRKNEGNTAATVAGGGAGVVGTAVGTSIAVTASSSAITTSAAWGIGGWGFGLIGGAAQTAPGASLFGAMIGLPAFIASAPAWVLLTGAVVLGAAAGGVVYGLSRLINDNVNKKLSDSEKAMILAMIAGLIRREFRMLQLIRYEDSIQELTKDMSAESALEELKSITTSGGDDSEAATVMLETVSNMTWQDDVRKHVPTIEGLLDAAGVPKTVPDWYQSKAQRFLKLRKKK